MNAFKVAFSEENSEEILPYKIRLRQYLDHLVFEYLLLKDDKDIYLKTNSNILLYAVHSNTHVIDVFHSLPLEEKTELLVHYCRNNNRAP